jgi:hypothetical protein
MAGVGDGKGAPQIRWLVEGRRALGGNKLHVGQDRMEGEHDQDDHGAQVMQRQTRT